MSLESLNSVVDGGARERAAETPTTSPKRWKLFLITVVAVYPLTVVIPVTLTWLSEFVAPLRVFVIRGVVSATLLVSCLLFVILPLFNRVFRRWLTS
jgi:antibiotic biosynthesis monooxygenase (ABM) superfamily enzyme